MAVNGNNLEYTALSSFTGSDSFTYTVSDNRGGVSAAATVSVTVSAVNNQQTPSITFNGGNVVLTFWGVPGTVYTIQRSTDLIAWTDLSPTVTASTSQPYGQINYTDISPPMSGSGYYRLKP